MRKIITCVGLMTVTLRAASGQTFDVATIKPMAATDDRYVYAGLPGGSLLVEGLTLKSLIMEAYNVQAYQISGGPGWVSTNRWDVQAKADGVQGRLTAAQERPMLRALLEDRFHLKIHRETREMPIYDLVSDKNGPNLTPTKQSAPGGRWVPGSWDVQDMSTTNLVAQLSRQLVRTVVDQTGLTGRYDIKLEWAPGENEGGNESLGLPPNLNSAGRRVDPNRPSVFTAIREQLGLRLESSKGPVEIVIIDRADMPSEN